MKRILLLVLLFLLIGVLVIAWLFLGPTTGFEASKKALYIRSNASTKEAVLDSLKKNELVSSQAAFSWLANRMGYWNTIKPGKYEIKRGSSVLSIARMLRNGRQTPVNLVINKIRTKEDLARLVGNRFECDSTQMISFLTDRDSLRTFEVDSVTAMWMVIPNTYTFFWNTTPKKIFRKLYDASQNFWNDERKEKAKAQGLTPLQAYTLASIVEEETNANAEKGNISSVYLNRLHSGMPLQADPTVKYAMRNFGLKRIYEKYLLTESTFNTYRNKGLPPGPICTPSKTTIDAVLNTPATNYLYFVADTSFNGTHRFSATYGEHVKKAKEYQEALNERELQNKAKLEVK